MWVAQFTDLYSMLKINAFDNICHEHLEYYTLSYLNWLLPQHGLEIFDVSYNKVNGGSLRIYVAHTGERAVNPIVLEYMEEELNYLVSDEGSLESFFGRMEEYTNTIVSLLVASKVAGKTIHVLGASTKGNTYLQYAKITDNLIPYAAEVNSDKFGLKTVGTNIQIISEKESLAMKPDAYLV